ncbi:hypothetical protein SAMN05444350_101281 [Bacteroides stercorirosoris]|uniref:Uncharacterized protein n=1 Tax=Bacteroides stercorirosoris TaxID=871324 RepID=A0A1M6AJ51_9BACE|nr:hypothetical protein SAMN05444350_101281 [Bacteroides stercorirosoris]
MRRIKWSPILILFPFIITLHTLWRAYVCVWTAFSFYIIIGFIAAMLIVLLLDRFFVMCVTIKTLWLTEILVILFALLMFLNKCT